MEDRRTITNFGNFHFVWESLKGAGAALVEGWEDQKY